MNLIDLWIHLILLMNQSNQDKTKLMLKTRTNFIDKENENRRGSKNCLPRSCWESNIKQKLIETNWKYDTFFLLKLLFRCILFLVGMQLYTPISQFIGLMYYVRVFNLFFGIPLRENTRLIRALKLTTDIRSRWMWLDCYLSICLMAAYWVCTRCAAPLIDKLSGSSVSITIVLRWLPRVLRYCVDILWTSTQTEMMLIQRKMPSYIVERKIGYPWKMRRRRRRQRGEKKRRGNAHLLRYFLCDGAILKQYSMHS